MIRNIAAALGTLLLFLVLAAPATSVAAQPPLKVYATKLTQINPARVGAEYAGTLKITIASDGIVSGWYIPESQPRFIPVTGGSEDGRIWFDIGERGQLHFQGTFQKDGSLTGSATEFTSQEGAVGDETIPITFDFQAVLQKS